MNQPSMPYVETMTAMANHFANFVGPRKPVKPLEPVERRQVLLNDNARPELGWHYYPFEPWVAFPDRQFDRS